MKTIRIAPIVLACALATLTACGGEDPDTAAGPAATSASVPAATIAAAPSTAATASPPAAADTAGAKQLCESVKKSGDEMKARLVSAVQAGGDPNAEVTKILAEMGRTATTLAATAGDNATGAALKRFGAENTKAAKAADPSTAADSAAMEKAGANLNAACKAAGVTTGF
ncbi:hypothetical protein [Micromonospora sp. WMMD980]|uniref:hypothetical protein n=1 Tax=Micromonospora sp. WMMD980 TaxID=3016088 RepID=UPI002417B3C0|nr:hypothetical protein [Micromonospora sp. WMMD980]MDG4799131.1 hypothetical protein [Micromonospora sp. WMMD980]